MNSITSFLSVDHDRCDALFFQAEASAGKGDWAAAANAFHLFKNALEHHLSLEEDILFPAMGDPVGNVCGPTAVMRSEHQQMRKIIQDMATAISQQDAEEYLGNSETLNIMMQQHNFKEENMLYVMADRQLARQCDEIIAAMEGIKELA